MNYKLWSFLSSWSSSSSSAWLTLYWLADCCMARHINDHQSHIFHCTMLNSETGKRDWTLKHLWYESKCAVLFLLCFWVRCDAMGEKLTEWWVLLCIYYRIELNYEITVNSFTFCSFFFYGGRKQHNTIVVWINEWICAQNERERKRARSMHYTTWNKMHFLR